MATTRVKPWLATWRLLATVAVGLSLEVAAMPDTELASRLLPPVRELTLTEGRLALRGVEVSLALPAGAAHEACGLVVMDVLEAAGARVRVGTATADTSFRLGEGAPLPALPAEGHTDDGYVLAISPRGVAAAAATPTGLLYAAQTLRQVVRLAGGDGSLPALTIRDSPEFRWRGLYIEGGQERHGQIVSPRYLEEQIRRLAEFKLNLLVIECYNLFPYKSFPQCADAGTLAPKEVAAVVAEARRWHVTLMPSLQTLAQASELVWGNEAGVPYREATAPGLICPSSPEVYPFIKGLYRDLLEWFDGTPLIGIGCSEIDMQWQGRYCPRCQARVGQGQTVRDLLLGHATECIRLVHELAAEMGRPVRPLMWGDEFYMYGPGRDWVGIDRIPKDVVMGYWKYWPDYAGIAGLMERGYDVLGISALYNHCFYLADLSPEDPPKSWPSMAQTGVLNITGMVRDADAARRAHPGSTFLGVATASFSKHRLRAFDSLWYGFVLNGYCTWAAPTPSWPEDQPAYTRAFTWHDYDARSDAAAAGLAEAYERLDRCKSRLELANQTLHDVVGVYDTQEAGYQGNSLLGAWQRCRELIGPDGAPQAGLEAILTAAGEVRQEVVAVRARLEGLRPEIGRRRELEDLLLAAEKIGNHAARQELMAEAQGLLALAPSLPPADARQRLGGAAARWAAHGEEVRAILDRVGTLYAQGDPCGYRSVLGDLRRIQQHLARLAASGPAGTPAPAEAVLVDEGFAALDPARWEVLGEPRVEAGRLETRAPGGWERYCGLVTRQSFALATDGALVIEFELTPLQMGIDSQLLASAAPAGGEISYRFSFYGPRDRFGVYTQSSVALGEEWVDGSPGWRLRAQSPEAKVGETFHVRAELTRRSWRVVVRRPDQGPWEMPFWYSGPVPMDDLPETRLLFGDVEPENGTAASRWGAIRIWRESPRPAP